MDSKQRKDIENIIGNELYNYVPLEHNSLLLTKIWDLSELIRNREILQVKYIKANGEEVIRKIKPVSIIFSEYYFYLIAYFKDLDSPIVYR